MSATPGTPAHQRRQHVAFGVLSLVAAGFTGILSCLRAAPAALLRRSTQTANTAIVIWPCIAFVSSLEPVLVHLRTGLLGVRRSLRVRVHARRAVLFRRYDFMSMYAFRLVFYMWWHVTWGYVRFRWLF